MFKSRCVKNYVIASLLVLCISNPLLWAQSSSGDDLLKMIPGETIFCVRINNFNNSMNQLDQFLAGASPMPMGVSMLIRGQLIQLFGSPQLSGINMDGSLAVFGVIIPDQTAQTNPAQNIFVGILVPVTDYKQFIDGNQNCEQPDEKGVSKITKNGTPIMLATQSKNYALLSLSWANDYDKLITIAKQISGNNSSGLATALDASQTKQAMTDSIWAYCNMQQVSTTFGPLITNKINEIKETFKNLEAGPAGTVPANMQNIINIYAQIIDVVLKETKSLSIGINPKPDVLNITKTICAVPGTDMAKMFAANASSQTENTLLAYLEDGAMMNFGWNMNAPLMRQFQAKSIDFLTAIGGDAITAENVTKLKTLVSNVLDCLAGPVAYSVSADPNNKPPFVVKYAVAVKDEKKFDSLIKDATDMMTTGGLLDFYKGFGLDTTFTVQRGINQYKGVSIDAAKLAMKSTQTGSPQAQMITSMYGEGFDYRWALVKGLFVCAVGGDVDAEIHKLIDQAQAISSRPIGSEIKSALALQPAAEKADFLATFNVLRFFNMITAMVPIPLPRLNVQSKSDIVVSGKAGDNKLVVDISVPKAHLAEVIGAFMTMQQQQMQQTQKN
jgi:hypothetical protein